VDYLLELKVTDIKCYFESKSTDKLSVSTNKVSFSFSYSKNAKKVETSAERKTEIKYVYSNNLTYNLREVESGMKVLGGEAKGIFENTHVLSETKISSQGARVKINFSDFEDSKLSDIRKSIINSMLNSELAS
jgi:hypothetical protein